MKADTRYTQAGVDIDKAMELVKTIKPMVSSTFKHGVLTEIGGFAGLFALDLERYQQPVLVSSTDGVGTKIKIAVLSNRHKTIGIDLVAMCVNDILVCGAQPLFFMDYFATGRLEPETAVDVIKGITDGCKEADCSLIGGETAEMPGLYAENDYDLAGFVVGAVDRDKIIDGSEIGVGQVIIGMASTGLHSNGFSLVRKILFEELGLGISDRIPEIGDLSLGEILLTPTKIYTKIISHLLKQKHISGMVHITGGAFLDNIPRILPKTCKAIIKKNSWPIPPIFRFLQEKGKIPEEEMFRTFNCGIGMVLIVHEADVQDIVFQIQAFDEQAYVIGHIEKRDPEGPPVVFQA
ncbi:MAG: phosphoribosylformylglycinamidine cyclo-ligase [Nitrospiraceae bacterium]|nr:phosphoribosylformylglycinamidine cyclo-ligase [Nitrospiraceae bacterium]